MKQLLRPLLFATFALAGTLAFTSCGDDTLSRIGESIQPGHDKIEGEATTLEFDAKTIATPTLYTDGTRSLLGALIDHTGSTVTGEFIKQIRTASPTTFEESGNAQLTIDSVDFRIYYDRAEGEKTSEIKVNVYQLAEPVSARGTTYQTLGAYRKGATLLGSATLQPSKGTPVQKGSSLNYLSIPLTLDLGKKFYQASISPTLKDAFSTQARFDKEIFPGFYVTPATGKGFLLEVAEVALLIHYSVPKKDKPTERTRYVKSFVDTKLTARLNALSSGDVSSLTASSAEYTYVKGPAGVTTQYILSVDQLQKLLKTTPKPTTLPVPSGFIGRSWMLADANFSIQVKSPEGQLTNLPEYLLLLPADQVKEYFSAQVQTLQAGKSYLSKKYEAKNNAYQFNNIARIVTEHLAKYATYTEAGGWTITTPLTLSIVPVSVTLQQNTITGISELIRPSFVRLSKASKDLRVSFVSVQLQQK